MIGGFLGALIGLHIGAVDAACRHLGIIDDLTGKRLRGIEDMVLDHRDGALYLAADDRWAVEQAEDDAAALPQGGIYRLDADRLAAGAPEVRVSDMSLAFKRGRDFHPQGIGLYLHNDGQAVLAVVNRKRVRNAGSWTRRPAIEIFEIAGAALEHRETVADPALCRANDVALFDAGTILVSRDGEACGGWARRFELALGPKAGSVAVIARAAASAPWSVRPLVEGIGIANGLALGGQDAAVLYVAASRGAAIRPFRLSRGRPGGLLIAEPLTAIGLQGGPDNLNWDGPGRRRLLAAVHPSLWRLALYRNRWFRMSSAPSRIVAVDTGGGEPRVLHDDPDGTIISAATAAVRSGGRLVIGSVTDDGLAICDPA